MKILLINGSPHARGCTYTALAEVEKTLCSEGIDTEIFHIGTKPISGCIDCKTCFKNESHKCVFDDIVNIAAQKLKESDGLIIGSPVYYSSPNGSLISFLDRLFRILGSDVYYKVGASVVSARRAGTTASFDVLNKYFTINNMPVVSSQYWNMVHGNTPDEVKQDKEGLQIMRTLGKNTAWLVKSISVAKEQGVTLPLSEKRIRTNFIR